MKKKLIYTIGLIFLFIIFGLLCFDINYSCENFRDDLAGIEYSSVRALEVCIDKHLNEPSHEDNAQHLSEMNCLYVPPVCLENTEKIDNIIVAPAWVQVSFEQNGFKYLFEHHFAD